jgi:hypothetical protein
MTPLLLRYGHSSGKFAGGSTIMSPSPGSPDSALYRNRLLRCEYVSLRNPISWNRTDNPTPGRASVDHTDFGSHFVISFFRSLKTCAVLEEGVRNKCCGQLPVAIQCIGANGLFIRHCCIDEEPVVVRFICILCPSMLIRI